MIFNVQNINYVITGNSEKMINIDILSTNAELQTQSACMTFVTDEGLDSIVNSPLSSVSAKEALSAEYRTHRLKRLDETANSIISVPDNANTTYALFDVKDVAVKCLTIMNPSKNDPEDERNCKIIYSNELKNIFNAHMAENPVGFCQMNDAAIGLAVEGIRFPAMLKTNLLDTREERLENDQNSMEWFFKVQSEKNDIYTYIPLSNLTLNHRPEDPISTWIDPQGYYFVAKSYKSLSNDVLDDFFINRFDHLSVETNQILKIFTEPLDENRSKYNDFNNGIVVLVKPKDGNSRGRVSIKVGYGLEGILPDITCNRIIENDMIPHFRDNDYYGGVRDACITLMKYAKGEISVKRDRSQEEDLITLMLKLLVFMFLLYVLVSVVGKHSDNDGNLGGGSGGRRVIIGPMGGWGGSSRGSSWGGGGFGGGGFGGFGGGSFGGGGASGSW